MAKKRQIAMKKHHDPTTRKGSKKPPATYKADPKAGPVVVGIYYVYIDRQYFALA
jgi:hypothetical protein